METDYLGLSGLSLYAHCLAVGLCISSHLLQEEVSLTTAEEGSRL